MIEKVSTSSIIYSCFVNVFLSPRALLDLVVVAMAFVAVVMMVLVVMLMAAAAFVVMMIVMGAVRAGILRQHAGQQPGDRLVRGAGNARVERDVCVVQRDLCTHSDASTDQRIHTKVGQHAGKRAVAAAGDGDDFALHPLSLPNSIHLELGGMAEVLEDLAVFVGDCDFHNDILLKFFNVDKIAQSFARVRKNDHLCSIWAEVEAGRARLKQHAHDRHGEEREQRGIGDRAGGEDRIAAVELGLHGG